MKFHSIRIQNYKSINDITLYLSDVNLLIGQNNSGKSNILGALKLFSDYVYFLNYNEFPSGSDFEKSYSLSQTKNGIFFVSSSLQFSVTFIDDDLTYYLLRTRVGQWNVDFRRYNISQLFSISKPKKEIQFADLNSMLESLEYIEVDGYEIEKKKEMFNSKQSILFRKNVLVYNLFTDDITGSIQAFEYYLADAFSSSSIYSIQVEKLKAPARLQANEESVLPDGSNLVSFIDSMRDTNPKIIREIEKDLFRFTKEFESIRLIKVTGDSTTEATFKKLGLADKDDNTFWSDQLSEGVLYFLALLAIIHQPNPPHLLMLEEPEKGIHPRRIKEIIELIFQIAKDKGIRIILTTHSTYVVDQFTEFPEGVHIVDKIDKSTQVKNLKRDFLDKEEGREDKIDYLSSLGEHWAIGFLGGVPE